MLSVEQSGKRRERLLGEMVRLDVGLATVCDYRHVYYLTGRLVGADQPVALLLSGDGGTTVIGPEGEWPGVDRAMTYPMFSVETLVDDLSADVAELLGQALDAIDMPHRAFVEPSAMSDRVAGVLADAIPRSRCVDVRPTMLSLRKRKDADEIACIGRSVDVAEAGYAAAREAIRVGRTELDVHAAMYEAMIRELGSSFLFDGDFATGQRADRSGGPPTSRPIESGDLYVLDIFPRIDGYACDLCRTFAVDDPTSAQRDAWELVHGTLEAAAGTIRPGMTGGDVRAEMERRLHSSDLARGSFFHHAGHGIGLQPHESPRMIIDCGHVFEVGDVFTLEPGIYGPHLRGGIRLEHNYVLGADGPELLDGFPMDF